MKKTDEIQALFEDWNQALQSGDPGLVAVLYAPDAVLLPTVSSQVRHNRREIEDYFRMFLTRRPRGRIDQSNIRVFDEIAINSGVYTFELSPPGEDPCSVQARYTFVYRWYKDRWLIIEHHSSVMPE